MKITEKIKMVVMGLAAVATLGTAAAMAPAVGAESAVGETTGSAGTYTQGQGQVGEQTNLMDILKVIINGVLGVIGFVAVVMIILGGVQYTTSAGDVAKVTKAKNTILYGIVGLVIALLAFAIVNFVLTSILKSS